MVVLLPCRSHSLDGRSGFGFWWRQVSDPGGLAIGCLERTCCLYVEHGFLQPLGLLRSRELRQVPPIPFMEGDLQVSAAPVDDLDHDVIEKPFLNEVPVHLGGCDRTSDRD